MPMKLTSKGASDLMTLIRESKNATAFTSDGISNYVKFDSIRISQNKDKSMLIEFLWKNKSIIDLTHPNINFQEGESLNIIGIRGMQIINFPTIGDETKRS